MKEERKRGRIDEYVERGIEERARSIEVVRLTLGLSDGEALDWMDRSFEGWWKEFVRGCRLLSY